MINSVSGNSYEGVLNPLHRRNIPIRSVETVNLKPHLDDSFGAQNSISINSLPVELLVLIFDSCGSEGIWSDPLIPSLVHITSVCRHWRAAAFAAPHLWAKIMLYEPRQKHVLMVQQWLQRSQSCPLNIALRHEPYDENLCRLDVLEATFQILSLLLKNLSRWKSIVLRLTQYTRFPKLPVLTSIMPLERVELFDDGESLDPATARYFWQVTFSSPSLRQASWRSHRIESVGYLPQMVDTHWERLTHIDTQFIIDDKLLETLSQCQALETLHIRSLDEGPVSLYGASPFCIPRLRSLTIRSEGTIMDTLLDQLILPNLQDADLYYWGGGLRSWIDLCDRSSASLTRMKIHAECSLSEAEVAEFLSMSAFKSLKTLEASFDSKGYFVVEQLSRISDNILPELVNLELYLYDSCIDGSISAMVRARMAPGYPLRRVHVEHFPDGNPNRFVSSDSQALEQMRRDGFSVTYCGV